MHNVFGLISVEWNKTYKEIQPNEEIGNLCVVFFFLFCNRKLKRSCFYYLHLYLIWTKRYHAVHNTPFTPTAPSPFCTQCKEAGKILWMAGWVRWKLLSIIASRTCPCVSIWGEGFSWMRPCCSSVGGRLCQPIQVNLNTRRLHTQKHME